MLSRSIASVAAAAAATAAGTSSLAGWSASTSRAAASSPALARQACAICCGPPPAHIAAPSRGFQSSALVARGVPPRGGSKSGGASRFGGSRGNDKRDRFGKPRFGDNRGKKRIEADFSIPEPPTAQHVARQLVDKIDSLAGNPHFPAQLVVYGIKGDAARQVLQLYTPSKSPQADQELAIKLFRTWSEEAQDEIMDIALLHDGGEVHRPGVFGYLPDAISSFTVEGEACLGRFCLSAFLDWMDSGYARVETSGNAGEVSLARSQLMLLRSCMDLRFPAHQYPHARTLMRSIHLHVGPTNSGKTHGALVALSKARTGVFAGPLRLLAHEVWDRFNTGTVSPGVAPRACNLVTGEEQRTVDALAGLVSCTVEMVSNSRTVDVGVIDEIQMIGDAQRGFAWTAAVLGLPAKELHLCGEASVIPLIEKLAEACGDHLTIHRYERLTPLSVADESLHNDLARIERGDCIVAFSRSGIFALKREIEQKTGLRCAVAYGALPPETKAEQAKLFNEGKLDVMVASDAIGMGLNLRIKRVVFDTLTKWNGSEEVTLSASQIKQIAGRAGRYGTQSASTKPADLGGIVTTRHEHELEVLRAALASPLRPITRAAIQPPREALSQLSAMLPSAKPGGGLRALSQLYADVALLARIEAAHYFVADFSQQLAISPLVESASAGMLTVAERETFSNAPANMRDERVVAFLTSAVAQFSRGGLVRFDAAADALGMLEVEEQLVELMHQASEARRRATESANSTTPPQDPLPLVAYLGHNSSGGVGGGGSGAHPLINIATLLVMESLHRCFTLYLWLSFRFPLAFCYRAEVERRKKRAEDAIDFVLQGIRFGRAKRLQALGRAPRPHKR
ncbi:hypothetical protein PaG_00112 [Moesziomyces aphidis]|uniref:ATP-dependent RNA helicase SUV3, mitochondrial n=1 Tax=Moesziomyces aphidis TaxID=84754 RepID=W3VUT0_MOEAP|nr:hypothetical protein PaG_00112 [Moesziomyces aphidis]